MAARSCENCIHYRVCHIAKSIMDLYNSLPASLWSMADYEKIIAWGRSFAHFCLNFEAKKEKKVE